MPSIIGGREFLFLLVVMCGDPWFAAFHHKVTSEILSPSEVRRHLIVGFVPAGVLHKCECDARKNWPRRVCAAHCFGFENAFLPVSQRRSFSTLILQLGAFKFWAVEMSSNLFDHSRRDHDVNVLLDVAVPDSPFVSYDSLDCFIAPLMDLKPERCERFNEKLCANGLMRIGNRDPD